MVKAIKHQEERIYNIKKQCEVLQNSTIRFLQEVTERLVTTRFSSSPRQNTPLVWRLPRT